MQSPTEMLDAEELSAIYPPTSAGGFDLPMDKITPRSTRAERMFAHRARMEGKKIDRERRGTARTSIETRAQARRLFGFGSFPYANRHTGKPHDHAREIMRREMTPLKRREFASKVAGALGSAVAA